MTLVGTPHSRRALRMYVKLTGPLMVRGGYTRRVDALGGFVACEPVFSVGTRVEMELMLNPKSSAGVKVTTDVLAVHGPEEREAGVELRWVDATTSRAPAALQRFLSSVLGVVDPSITSHDDATFRHRYVFPTQGPVQVGSVFQAMKSRPIGQGPRRTVMHTDPNMGPAKIADVLGGAPDLVTPPPSPGSRRPSLDDGLNVSTDTIPELVHDGVEEEIEEDDLVPYDLLTPSQPIGLAKPVTTRGETIEDRRKRERLALAVPVSYFVNSRGTVGRAHNVSRSGLYIETSQPPPKVGSRVNVRFPVRSNGTNHIVLLTCVVERHRGAREKPGTKMGFAVGYLVVDELGRTGLFSHFITEHL
jgi:hypothetical protein